MSLEVIAPGMLTLIEDGGRPGLSNLGVGPSGAFDRRALRQANRLVGNSPDAAGLEVLGGGLRLLADRQFTVAITGAVGPLTLAGIGFAHGRAAVLAAGMELHLGPFTEGLRGYVAVAGGIDAPMTLGSRSTDTLARLGPPAVAAGDILRVGPAGPRPVLDDVPALLTAGEITVETIPGPRDDWFTADAQATFFTTSWEVDAESSRVGLRLAGPTLQRSRTGELASEPVVRGSVQVTSAGLPVILGPDHPVTGGYPVIAVVSDRDTDLLAQAGPGRRIRFRRKSTA